MLTQQLLKEYFMQDCTTHDNMMIEICFGFSDRPYSTLLKTEMGIQTSEI